MLVEEVRAIYDEVVDEPDLTWLTVATRRSHLKRAYEEFRNEIRQLIPDAYTVQQDLSITDAKEYDFSLVTNPVRLLGQPAAADVGFGIGLTGPRIQSISLVCVVDGGNVTSIVRNAQRLQDVVPQAIYLNGYFPWTTFSWRLIKNKMLFDTTVNSSLRMYYVGESQIDWTKDATADNEFIGDFSEYHEFIPYSAALRYSVLDGAARNNVQRQLDVVRLRMQRDLIAKRNSSQRFVNAEYMG